MTAAAGRGAADPYADPSVYDILETPGTAREVDVLERIARAHGRAGPGGPAAGAGRRGVWLEPGCGTGRYLRVLAGRGHRVIGCDREPAMIAYARRTFRRRGLARRARLLVADMASLADTLPAAVADVAIVPVNTFRHLASDRAALAHLAGVAHVLRPGGIYVVGISLSVYGGEWPDEDVWTGTRGRCRVRQVIQYLPPEPGGPHPRRERVLSHLVIERPRGAEHRDAVYGLRCYDEAQWASLVGRSPLRRLASLDARGRPRAGRRLPYQHEVLLRP
jgi:SAM-dependent methyltransferase